MPARAVPTGARSLNLRTTTSTKRKLRDAPGADAGAVRPAAGVLFPGAAAKAETRMFGVTGWQNR
jgi:hypothetical protein